MRRTLFALLCALLVPHVVAAQSLEQQLTAEGADSLARAALQQGDAQRGAIVFHQPQMACNKCHSVGDKENPLGPELTRLPAGTTNLQLVESILEPSKVIRRGYEPVTLLFTDGRTLTGLVVEEKDDSVVIRVPSGTGETVVVPNGEIEERTTGQTSIMPAGQVNQLPSRQQFLDLIRYLIDIRDGGATRALELQPPESLTALHIPEYESHVDHAGIIADLDQAAFERGQAIYNRLCVNCHGTRKAPGSLPTSLRFAEGKFKNGSDPFTMYQTLTRGFGLMAPQTWMVPQQKYDVIHYIREAYLRGHNGSQLFKITPGYLASLPAGDTRGPEPSTIEPWVVMNYGPSLIHTYEVGSDGSNFAYKGIAVRLDPGPGGVSGGRAWMIFDHDTMRMAAAWTAADDASPFIDWNGIQFNGQHQVHPCVSGDVQVANLTGPGWAEPGTGTFADDQRVLGRDGLRYGPLPRKWARYRGLYHAGQQVVIAYDVGDAEVLELPGMLNADVPVPGSAAEETVADGVETTAPTVFTRTLQIGPRSEELVLQVAHDDADRAFETFALDANGHAPAQFVAVVRPVPSDGTAAASRQVVFDGATQLETDAADFDMTGGDFTVTARIRTGAGGTIFGKTNPGPEWVHDGKAFFVRGGRLCYDIGWVGVVQSQKTVNDNRWHDVALTWDHDSARVRLFVDGQRAGQGELRPKSRVDDHVVRVGFAAPNFPNPSFFDGELDDVRFYSRVLSAAEFANGTASDDRLVAHWRLETNEKQCVSDLTGHGHDLAVGSHAAPPRQLAAGLTPAIDGSTFYRDEGDLRLRVPAGDEPVRFTIWMAALETERNAREFAGSLNLSESNVDLESLTHGGPAHWPQVLNTTPVIGTDEDAFAVDVLTHPLDNPWLAQMRFTGFDFFEGGDRMVVSTWDGDVWQVSSLNALPATAGVPGTQLEWRRIASGLFQPLGVKIVRGDVYLTCRDQLVILRDLNGDGETDFYECFNNDQQVTDHFHEFAMGLQTDDKGNFYYAKSARHALPALVPHHGTLLRVSPDGSRTDIIATGFRAANGVCVNPDGTFFVTDQEGHWTPKNRINWVKEGGFYGNMLGYHDVTDSSDDAMEQPLCWITNSFDRSPAEPLWCDSPRWGPLDGSLLNLSYGYGQVYVVPHEEIDGQMQGGMCALPIPRLPTGLIRGRFHPVDRQLYTCGMFAWAGSQTQPGGFYRIRATGKPSWLPTGLHATTDGMTIEFSDPLDPEAAADAENYAVKIWSLRRTANYGSDHYNEHELEVAAASVSDDGRTVRLSIPDMTTTWCMEIRCALRGPDGKRVNRVIHNTVHRLGQDQVNARHSP